MERLATLVQCREREQQEMERGPGAVGEAGAEDEDNKLHRHHWHLDISMVSTKAIITASWRIWDGNNKHTTKMSEAVG